MTAQLVTRARYVGFVMLTLTGVSVGAAWYALPAPEPGRGSALWFVFAVALGELIVLDEADQRPIPTSIAVMGAFLLLGNSPVVSALVVASGWALGNLVRVLRGVGRPQPTDGLARLIGAWALPTFVAAATWVAPGLSIAARGAPDEPLNVLAFAVVSVAIVFGLPLWDAVETGSPLGTAVTPLYVGRLRATWLAGIALAAGAGLAALVYADLGAWGMLLTLLPLLAARSGLLRLASVRRTHDQTVRAMSRIPEFVRAVPEGHADRVAARAISMARDLGLPASELDSLREAALLHEIGWIVADHDDREHAQASASVVREVPHLHRVADIIERHRDVQHLGYVVGGDRVPLAARILRTACDFDRLIAASELDPDSWDAVRHFHVTSGHQHEPGLIQALARSVDRTIMI